jgi:hypothetical protein
MSSPSDSIAGPPARVASFSIGFYSSHSQFALAYRRTHGSLWQSRLEAVELSGYPYADNLKPDADLWGTAYGLTPSEKFFLVLDQFRHYRNINIDASTCTNLLSNHVDLLLG